ncbi:MAG: hypothetical protein KatS3mg002_1119 [Candidatus Woesearchaeota archaeon]|nr:MAG: hypothetical protein KatS3mg002_1119 [Candidatus Woesearchaeota archaeon]
MNKIYRKMYIQKAFTLNEANKIIKNRQVCKNTLNRLIAQNLIKRLRKNLYYIMPLDNPEFEPDKIHIATKLRNDAIICNASALQIQGIPLEDKNVTFYSKHNAKIIINKITYNIIKNKYNFGIKKIEYNTGYMNIEISITDFERTIIDCIRTRTITIEQMINILKNPKITIEVTKIINYLEKYKKPILYNKIGLILDITKPYIKAKEEDTEVIRKKLSKKIFYAREKGIKLIRPRYKYYKKWNIMIPDNIYNIINSTLQKTTV